MPSHKRNRSSVHVDAEINAQLASQRIVKCPPAEFLYEHDLDKNGVFFYLGTLGFQTVWQNPDQIRRLVRGFASSISAGTPSNLAGRALTNNHSANEAFSFFGLQLAQERRLLPTCYSVRNRPSESYAMLSWRFEGSNDLINW